MMLQVSGVVCHAADRIDDLLRVGEHVLLTLAVVRRDIVVVDADDLIVRVIEAVLIDLAGNLCPDRSEWPTGRPPRRIRFGGRCLQWFRYPAADTFDIDTPTSMPSSSPLAASSEGTGGRR